MFALGKLSVVWESNDLHSFWEPILVLLSLRLSRDHHFDINHLCSRLSNLGMIPGTDTSLCGKERRFLEWEWHLGHRSLKKQVPEGMKGSECRWINLGMRQGWCSVVGCALHNARRAITVSHVSFKGCVIWYTCIDDLLPVQFLVIFSGKLIVHFYSSLETCPVEMITLLFSLLLWEIHLYINAVWCVSLVVALDKEEGWDGSILSQLLLSSSREAVRLLERMWNPILGFDQRLALGEACNRVSPQRT